MNIQVFGTKKSFDTKKAQRYFKERRVKFQFIDLKEKGMSKGELESVARAVGGIDVLVDPKAKDADTVSLLAYQSPDRSATLPTCGRRGSDRPCVFAHPDVAERTLCRRGAPIGFFAAFEPARTG